MRESPIPHKQPGGIRKRLHDYRWLAAALLVVALVAVGLTWRMYVRLKDTIARAEERIKAAELAEQEAIVITREAQNTRDTVYVKTLRYEIAAQEAIVAAQRAEVAEKQANAKIRNARADHRRAEHALDDAVFADLEAQLATYKLNQSTTRLADLYLEQSRLFVAQLAYDEAFVSTQDALALGVSKPAVSDAMLEFAYLYAETGNLNRAWSILDTVYTLVGDTLQQGKKDRDAARDAIGKRGKTLLRTLDARYYPKMITIPGGTDTLGGIYPTPKLPVEVAYFQLAETETTWWQYSMFCAAKGVPLPNKPAGVIELGSHPATSVSWYEAVDYANWLNERFGLESPIQGHPGRDASYRLDTTEKGFRLPTECEWEYAARARSRTTFAGSDTLEYVGWTLENSKGKTYPVKQLRPNGFGLYDMSGNAWEWCWDWGEEYPKEPQTNYTGPEEGTERVFRGGSSYYKADYARTAARYDDAPGSRFNAFGFRVAR